MKIKPCGYRLIVKPDVVDKMSDGGIALVMDERQEQAAQVYGDVTAIGPECWKGDDPWAKVGDRVCYVRHAGKYILDTDTNEEFVVLNDEDILVITEKEE